MKTIIAVLVLSCFAVAAEDVIPATPHNADNDSAVAEARAKYKEAADKRDKAKATMLSTKGQLNTANNELTRIETQIASLREQFIEANGHGKQLEGYSSTDAELRRKQQLLLEKIPNLERKASSAEEQSESAIKDFEVAEKALADSMAPYQAVRTEALKKDMVANTKIYKLVDGREFKATSAIESGDSITVKTDKGEFVTIKKADIQP